MTEYSQSRNTGAKNTGAKNTGGDLSAVARHTIRLAATAGLATLEADGAPFASLVTVATTLAGEPVLLLSDLARHTANLRRDPRASLLLVTPGGEHGDPLAGARVSVNGQIAPDADAASRRRFLARHEEAAGYAGFKDFAFYRLAVESGHVVAGFGRITDLTHDDLVLEDCEDLAKIEASAVEHMNADHREALSLYATRLLGLPAGDWQTTGADPEGIDLRAGTLRGRVDFASRVSDGKTLRTVLVELTGMARQADRPAAN